MRHRAGLVEWKEPATGMVSVWLGFVSKVAEGVDADDDPCVTVTLLDGLTVCYLGIYYAEFRDVWLAYLRGEGDEDA